MAETIHQPSGFGSQLRSWRQRRGMSQLAFALDAEISQKHLSFIETGRSSPSRDMVIRLAEVLDMPLRERNTMLAAAGYAPVYAGRSLDDRSLAAARAALDRLIEGHAPYPALAIDRHWNVVTANAPAMDLMALVTDRALLAQPVNVLRLTLHPRGLAAAILNLGEWRGHLLERLRRQIRMAPDETLRALLAELEALPATPQPSAHDDVAGEVFTPLRLRVPGKGVLSLLATRTVFGTPLDVTLSEIAIESFFPADDVTRAHFS